MRSQIDALKDGMGDDMLWNSGNRYTENALK